MLVKVTRDTLNKGVAIVTLNSPKNLNAMTAAMGDEFKLALSELSQDNTVRCMILNGEGKAFSAGGDLAFLKERLTTSPATNAEIMKSFYKRFLSIRHVPFPTIASINGHAVGAAACVAMACDIRMMADRAKFGLNFVRIGLTPGMGGSHILGKMTNQQVAARMILTGDLISAEEAVRLGIVLESHPAEELHEKALHMARRIASASPVAVRGAVRSIRLAEEDGLEKALWREAESQAIAYASPDMAEGLRAIISKQDPIFNDLT